MLHSNFTQPPPNLSAYDLLLKTKGLWENTWKYQVAHREVEFITFRLTDPPCTAQVVVCFKLKYQRLSSHIILNFLHEPKGERSPGCSPLTSTFCLTSVHLHRSPLTMSHEHTHKRRAGAERRSHIISVPVIFHKSASCASLKRHERQELRASAWQKKMLMENIMHT